MTRFQTLSFAAITAIALPASVYAEGVTNADANGDGVLTIDEVQVVFPEITAEAFTTMDTNADGALDDSEVVAAQDAGLIPA